MPARRVIYVVVDVDEVPVRAFTEQEAADAIVAADLRLHVVAVPLGPLEDSDGS